MRLPNMARPVLALVLTLKLAGCATAPDPKPDVGEPQVSKPLPVVTLQQLAAWRSDIPDAATFERLSKRIGDERIVKLTIDLRTDKTYYFDVKVHRLHRDFAFRELFAEAATPSRRQAFNRNYDAVKQDFLLCTLSNHGASDVWTLTFWEGDRMTADHVRSAMAHVSSSFYMAPKLRFMPTSPRQHGLIPKLTGVPTITPDSVYNLADEHTFNIGRRVGVLRVVAAGADVDALTFKPHEIVVLPEPVPEITAVNGIISEQYATPLAHVNLRAAAWGIPHLGLRGAAKKLAPLNGKIVFFEATRSGHVIREATEAERELLDRGGRMHTDVQIPPADLETRELRSLSGMRATEAAAYGAKAANLGEVAQLKFPWIKVPAGFGVPIVYMVEHMRRHGLDKKVDALLADPQVVKDAAYRKTKLAELRAAIEAAPIDQQLLAAVSRRVKEWKLAPGKGVFARSSTNAEDLPGFTGAGLYTTVPNVIGDEALSTAIRTVWASVWNFRAYEERAFYGIAHKNVHGAVLIQIGVDATAAGVLITANVMDPLDRGTYTINAKSGLGMRVVSGKKRPEHLLYDPDQKTIRVLSRSSEATMLVFDAAGGIREVPNPAKGRAVLSDQRVYALGEAARAVAALFHASGPIDIEWLFEDETLFIVQARPWVTR